MSATDTGSRMRRQTESGVAPLDYGKLNAVYLALLAGIVLAARQRGSEPVPAREVLPMGAATFALAKVISKEKIGTFVREPFVEEAGGGGGRPRGHGVRAAVGELVTCTRCAGAWSAAAVVGLRLVAPDAGRTVTGVLATSAANDFLQAAFSWVTARSEAARQRASSSPGSSLDQGRPGGTPEMTDIAETRYEEVEGRCQAVDEDGIRCPNPAEPGSRYCGLPDHQALEDVDSDHVVAPAAELAEAGEVAEGPIDLVDEEPGRAGGMAAEPGPYGGLDEGAEEAAAAEGAAAIGGRPEVDTALDEEPDPAARPVLEGGGGEAAGQEQAEEDLRRAAEEPEEADLTAEGQGFDEPTRQP